jgi:2-polyprenyl-3-methyl-5-hydroxy-6-metoxy-1,4-benzoquinol methylase
MTQLMDDVQFEAHQAHEESHWWFTARREIILSIVSRLLSDEHRPSVLDVGCGTGCTVAAFSRHYEAVGIDASADAIRRARNRYPDCAFIHGTIQDVDPSFVRRIRLVTLMDVLEHVEHHRELLSSILAAVPDDALVVITVPADMSLWSEHDVVLGHYRRYDAPSLACLFRDLHVECRLLAPFNTRLAPAVRFVRNLKPRFFVSRGAAGTDLKMPPRYVNEWLHSIFAGEKAALLDRLDRGTVDLQAKGVSLLAVLRKTTGTHRPRKPR